MPFDPRNPCDNLEDLTRQLFQKRSQYKGDLAFLWNDLLKYLEAQQSQSLQKANDFKTYAITKGVKY